MKTPKDPSLRYRPNGTCLLVQQLPRQFICQEAENEINKQKGDPIWVSKIGPIAAAILAGMKTL